ITKPSRFRRRKDFGAHRVPEIGCSTTGVPVAPQAGGPRVTLWPSARQSRQTSSGRLPFVSISVTKKYDGRRLLVSRSKISREDSGREGESCPPTSAHGLQKLL